MVNEKRLIDANEAKRRIIAFATGCHSEVLAVDSLIMMLNQSDTVDAVEVVHGRWEEHPRDTFAKERRCEKLRCTHCWHFFYHNYGDGKMYCPNCGAKMDGDGK